MARHILEILKAVAGSRRTTLVMAVPTIGINTARVLKNGEPAIQIIVIGGLLIMAATGLYLRWEASREKPEEGGAPRRGHHLENGVMAGMLLATFT